MATSLLEKESITTTWAKAKEAQSFTERIISYTKLEDKQRASRLAQGKLFKAGEVIPKLFNELGPRYAAREGGYTRVLRLEPRIGDNAPSAILELVDGKREMKFWLTARVVARLELQGLPIDITTQRNVDKLVRFRQNGEQEFRDLVEQAKQLFYTSEESIALKPVSEAPMNEPRKNIVVKPRPAKQN